MQKALERSNPHRRHIAELTNNLNMDYIRERIRRDMEPIHFGGLKSELITKNLIGGSLAIKPINYQADVISAFSVNSRMPKPNMSYHPDTLAVGQPIRYSGTVKNIITPSEYQNNQAVAQTGIIDDIDRVEDMKINDDYEKVKNMNLKDAEKYLKKKQGEQYRKDAENHPAIKQKKIKRMVRDIEANEDDNVYDLSNLYGSGRRPIGLPKPRVVGGKIKKKIKKK